MALQIINHYIMCEFKTLCTVLDFRVLQYVFVIYEL